VSEKTPTEIDPEALNKAVADNHAQAAPADAADQQLAQHASLLDMLMNNVGEHSSLINRIMTSVTKLEAFAVHYTPLIEEVLTTPSPPSATVSAAPADRLAALETWAASVVAHFQHKIPSPAAPPNA
jgi:hypothetical protein